MELPLLCTLLAFAEEHISKVTVKTIRDKEIKPQERIYLSDIKKRHTVEINRTDEPAFKCGQLPPGRTALAKSPYLCVIPTQAGLLNLNKMIQQVTRKIPVFSYWPYGCYCGLGGRGQPKDASDWCCQNHDCCYAHLKHHKCHIHTDNYDYTFSQGNIQCSDKGSWCEQQLCACDKEVAFCLKRNLETYKKHLRYYWRPRCTGLTPMC